MFVILKTDCIENQVVMNVILVYVGGEYKLVFATQYFFCQLHPNLMGFIGGNLPRLKAWIRCRARLEPLSMECRRVQAN